MRFGTESLYFGTRSRLPLGGRSVHRTKPNYFKFYKSILDSGWTGFRNMLHYKAEEAGYVVAEVKPEYTSQICSGCGIKVKKELGERTHDCPSCGLQLSRDLNAAKNILRVGMNSLGNRKVALEAHSL